MALTLEQIARLAGVSLSTASRVINEHPNVRPEVRERVWQVIHEQGYQPNLAARSLALKRTDDAEPAQTVVDQTSEVAEAVAS
jgi:LacI family transcriptional regulator